MSAPAKTAPGETDPVPAALAGFRHAAFPQLLHLVERWSGQPIFFTGTRSVNAEPVRFRTANRFSFPARDIDSLAWVPRVAAAPEDDDPTPPGDRLQVTITFLGLLGAVSPLPSYYVEDFLAAEKGIAPDEYAMRDFLDLFNHRLITLAYQGWKKYRHYATFQPGADDPISRYVFALLGLTALPERTGTARWLRGRIDWLRLLPYAGLLIPFGRSASALATVLSAYFDGLPVAIEEGVRRRAVIADEQRSALGRANTRLGDDFLLGVRVPDLQGCVRIVLGPLPAERFEAFRPDRPAFGALCALIEGLVRDPLEITLTVIRVPDARQGWRLGDRGRSDPAPAVEPEVLPEGDPPNRLGWSSWLTTPPIPIGRAIPAPETALSATYSLSCATRFRTEAGPLHPHKHPHSHQPREG